MVVLRNSGELESDEHIEESFFEELNCSYSSPPTTYSPPWGPTNFPYFPPSPTYFPVWGPTSFPTSPPSFPLCSPASPPPPSSSTSSPLRVRTTFTLFYDFQNQQHEYLVDLPVVDLALFVDYLIEDRGGELNVINGLEDGALNVMNELDASASASASALEINEFEQHPVANVDQLVVDYAGVHPSVIGYRGGKLSVISAGEVFTMNGVKYTQGQALSKTPEPSVVFQDKLSIRVWLGLRGQWVADICYGWNWLNLGTFRTAEGTSLAAESVKRWRGGKNLFDYPRPFLIENGSEPLQLSPTAQEENQYDGIGSEGTGNCAMADQAQFNSRCLEKRKTREKNSGGERRNKKASGVRIAIPLDDILQAKGMCLKDAANHLRAQQENPDAGFGNNEVEAIGVWVEGTWEALMEEAQLNSGGFGNNEAETIGVGIEGTGETVMEEAQLNSGCLGKKGKRKLNTPRGERGTNRTTGVRIAIPKGDILQTKGMRIEDAAKHLEVSKSTLKRICRGYGIDRWPPREEQELIGQSRPNKSPAVVDQEQIPQLNRDTLLPSNQVPGTSDTCSVKVKCEEGTIIKFRLSSPWRKVELEQEVKKRLPFEAGTYNIKYKDEDDELILISCDEDLEECISSSSPVGSRSIELFLKLK